MTNETTVTVKLGQRVREKFSGIEGTVIGITDWLYGCRRITIQPDGQKDGKPLEHFGADEPQCEVIEPTPAPASRPTGGPRDEVTRRSDPGQGR